MESKEEIRRNLTRKAQALRDADTYTRWAADCEKEGDVHRALEWLDRAQFCEDLAEELPF